MKTFIAYLTTAICAWVCNAGETYNDGQWTTSYPSVYVASTTWSTSYAYVTQAANVVVTLTSYVPCPVTSTTWVYQCGACAPQTTEAAPAVGVGTTTVTSFTTETPEESLVQQTVTSNGYVIVVSTPTQVNQIVNSAHTDSPATVIKCWAVFAAAICIGMLWA